MLVYINFSIRYQLFLFHFCKLFVETKSSVGVKKYLKNDATCKNCSECGFDGLMQYNCHTYLSL